MKKTLDIFNYKNKILEMYIYTGKKISFENWTTFLFTHGSFDRINPFTRVDSPINEYHRIEILAEWSIGSNVQLTEGWIRKKKKKKERKKEKYSNSF